MPDKDKNLRPIGSRWLFVWSSLTPAPPWDIVEVTSTPRSGDYTPHGGKKVKIGPIVTVRYVNEHESHNWCSASHETSARLDQLRPTT